MSHKFEGKSIAITGAASGVGLATAKLLAARGARLTICDTNADALSKAADLIDEMVSPRSDIPRAQRLKIAVVNVTNRAQVDGWINESVKDFGKLDGAANIAGITDGGHSVEEMSTASWDKTIAVNLTGVMHCMRAQIPLLRRKGSIVNVSSLAGSIAFGMDSAYVASKHGVIGLSKAAAREVGDREIRVNCVAPGFTKTPMLASTDLIDARGFTQLAIRRIADPSEIAELIAWLLCDSSSYITGTVNYIDGGWTGS